ncbi:MlaE family ABC transporter permease [Marinimicrobium alkaliphilum]|uniref:MlaE family ABC transporter permease n=1 Tax=Marinimicrobium alkaliphilum TaxID=2202654 RepID=UPI000DB9E302|nr:ABC transporter permease [Marinimicrobium alkaliphilum]
MTPSGTHVQGQIKTEADRIVLCGDWTLAHYEALRRLVIAEGQLADNRSLDWRELGELDTAGASLLVDLIGNERCRDLSTTAPDLSASRRALLETVAEAQRQDLDARPRTPNMAVEFLEDVGKRAESIWRQQATLAGFVGLTLTTLASVIFRPQRWRITALAVQIKQTGLDAMPIVALLTFLVGAVVAFLGATVLREFGATIYTVDLVAYSFLREFGVLLAAILLAGRTASAFAAQLGSMKANEEIDAIRALGLNPIELLVLPRVIAMIITLPILTFVGMVSGILGGMLVCALTLDITPLQFVRIIERDISVEHFFVGISKAPVFAFVIAVIGCVEGFKVTGSAESVGEHTTSSVVQSIFMVILLNAIAALFFMEMDW